MTKALHHSHPWSEASSRKHGEARVYQSVDAESFKKGMRQLASAVCIVTTGDGGEGRAGFTATAVCSVSAEPPQLLVCVNGKSATHQKIQDWNRFCVNVLSSAQIQIARRFASSQVNGDRFDAGDWATLVTGAPTLKGCLANFDCTLTQAVPAGSHSIFIGRIEAVSVIAGLEPLAFVDGQYLTIGTVKRGPDAELWDWS